MKDSKGKILGIILLLIAVFFGFDKETYENLKATINKYDEEEKVNKTVVENIVESEDLMIYFLDVGQADSILVKSNDEYMLIDAGNNEDGKLLVNYFDSIGITEFKYVIGTHAHEDHIGGMDDIIDNFDIETFYMPDAITTTKTFEDVLDSLENKNLIFDIPEVDSNFKLGNSNIEVIYTGNDDSDLNTTSIILKLTYKDVSVIFTGDTTSEIEKEILDKDLESDILKVAHHGSRYSSTTNFLKKVNPTYAIISTGLNNSYNHPHKETLNRLEKLNIKTYRTDELGTIIITSDGTNINFKNIKTNTNGN